MDLAPVLKKDNRFIPVMIQEVIDGEFQQKVRNALMAIPDIFEEDVKRLYLAAAFNLQRELQLRFPI